MVSERFFKKTKAFTLQEIASIAEVTLPEGVDPSIKMENVAPLEKAEQRDVSWAFIPSVREALKNTKAGAVIVPKKFLSYVPQNTLALISEDPHRSYGLLASAFYPYTVKSNISDKAYIDSTASIQEGTQVDAGAFIGKNVVIGKKCHIQANAVIQEGVIIGDNCIIGANSVVSHCEMGNSVYVYPGAMIGQDGFGFAMSKKGPVKVPQLGRVIIGDDVEIGANTTIDRGAIEDTVIGSGTRIDNLVQVGHNVKLGRCCILVSQVGIAGSCEFGDFVTAGGQAGFAGHLKIGTGSMIGAKSGVMNEIAPASVVMGLPAQPRIEWMRQQVMIRNMSSHKKDKLTLLDKIKFLFLNRRKNDRTKC